MKLSIISLLAATGLSLLASAATAAPSSAPASSAVAKHQTCDESDPNQLYDWSHWPNNPCWPCVSGDSSTTSAYPSWEVRPNCQ
jgi:hypothetical protein